MRIGKEGLETFVYRGDVANNALKTAGQELGLFLEKREVSHRYAKYDELTEAELIRQIRDEAQLLLAHHEREARERGEERTGPKASVSVTTSRAHRPAVSSGNR